MTWSRLAVAAVVGLLVSAPSALAVSPPINIGGATDPWTASVAVDSAGTAYIAWPLRNPPSSLGATAIDWCTISAGASGCSHSGQLAVAGGGSASIQGVPRNDVTVLLDGSTVRIFADVGSAVTQSDMPLQEWISTDGGASYLAVNGGTSVAWAAAFGNPISAVPMPGGGSFGMAFSGTLPQFTVFPDTTTPPECSFASNAACPFATLGSGSDVGFGAGAADFASESGSQPGVIGVFQGASSTNNLACSPSNDVVGYVYGAGNQAAGTNDYSISPGSPGSAWRTPHAGVLDCGAQNASVGGGASGFGAIYRYQPQGGPASIVYRPFDAATMTWGARSTISPTTARSGRRSPRTQAAGSTRPTSAARRGRSISPTAPTAARPGRGRPCSTRIRPPTLRCRSALSARTVRAGWSSGTEAASRCTRSRS